jgi:hypothetical protein
MKLIFSFLLLFVSGAGFCQQKNYLIKNNGDTIWGNITLKNKTFFVTGESTLEIEADDVSSIKSSSYKGHIVFSGNLSIYSDNLYYIELDYINKSFTDTVLILEELFITPKINLYYAVNNFKVPFYFYKTPSDPRPIQLVVYYHLEGGVGNSIRNPGVYQVNRGKTVIIEDKGYVNQLHFIMGDCKKIPQTMWELLSYRSYSLKQIIKKYNKCN